MGGTDVASNKHCAYFADFSDVSEEDRKPMFAPHIGENNYEILKAWGKSEEEARELLKSWGAVNV